MTYEDSSDSGVLTNSVISELNYMQHKS